MPNPGTIRSHAASRLAALVALACLGVWLLVGCVYLPLPEHRVDRSQKDFRDLVGDASSARPLRPYAVTRAQVLAALGPPPFVSDDGRAFGYTLATERAVWLFPFCFTATSAEQRLCGLRLVFDDHDRLTRWKLTHLDQELDWFKGSPPGPGQVIGALNAAHDGPVLKRPPERPPSLQPATQP